MKSKIVYHHKALIKDTYILELKIRKFTEPPKRFPDCIKYNLIFLEIKTGHKILYDNHLPQGHHYHIDENVFTYEFIDEDKLLNDFKNLVEDHFGVIL
jgi:hypothetical protein